MINTHFVLSGLLAAAIWGGGPALAQERPALSQERCGGEAPVADLGITISCDCTVNQARTRPWAFRSAITVAGVDANGAARGRLATGDRIVAVNGLAVTSAEGARALMALTPGRAARFTIERDGETRQVELTPGGMCALDRDAIGSYAPSPYPPPPSPAAPAVAPPTAAGGGTPRPPTPAAAPGAAPTVRGAPAPAPVPGVAPAPRAPTPTVPIAASPVRLSRVPVTPDLMPEGWLGFGLACGSCGVEREAGDDAPRWEFSAPPVVSGVEPGSPAAAAGLRADDRITHVNGIVVTDPRAGAALGGVRPGQALRLRVERDGAAREITVTAGRRTAAAAPAAAATLRYEGRLGDVDIEVRGGEPVSVEVRRDTGEVVISTATTVVTLVVDD